jgi:transposase InsO family protein
MEREIKQRLTWVKLYEETGHAGLVCRRCGISRPTLRKWWRRYQAEGEAGLRSRSRRPHHRPYRKVTPEHEEWMLQLRQERQLGARRIQHELERLHHTHLSTSTIYQVLQRHQVEPLRRLPRKRRVKRYEKAIPGERVQVDTIKIGPGKYQYTAIDDCTRYLVARLYTRRTAAHTLAFLQHVIEEMPFPIQRIQTDRGTEFTAYAIRETLVQWGIKWRPNRSRSPHLNGNVERVQKTALQEFYATVDLTQPIEALNDQLEDYQDYYNWERLHGSLGVTPAQRYYDRLKSIPLWDEVLAHFDPVAEERRHRFFGLEWFFDEKERRNRLQE